MAAAGHGVLGPGARGERDAERTCVDGLEGRNKGMQGRSNCS